MRDDHTVHPALLAAAARRRVAAALEQACRRERAAWLEYQRTADPVDLARCIAEQKARYALELLEAL